MLEFHRTGKLTFSGSSSNPAASTDSQRQLPSLVAKAIGMVPSTDPEGTPSKGFLFSRAGVAPSIWQFGSSNTQSRCLKAMNHATTRQFCNVPQVGQSP